MFSERMLAVMQRIECMPKGSISAILHDRRIHSPRSKYGKPVPGFWTPQVLSKSPRLRLQGWPKRVRYLDPIKLKRAVFSLSCVKANFLPHGCDCLSEAVQDQPFAGF